MLQETQFDLFDQPSHDEPSNDYHRLPASEKQIRFARALAERTGDVLPHELTQDRKRLSAWIDRHKTTRVVSATGGRFSNYPSSKQVAFAERLARARRRDIPRECFRDRGLMSRWIDHNKG